MHQSSRSRGIKHWQFHTILQERESTYADVLHFTELYHLSKGKDLERFFELRAEVQSSMERDGITVPLASDPK